jgi:hypothetical protein
MKEYTKPEMELIFLEEDIIVTSGEENQGDNDTSY